VTQAELELLRTALAGDRDARRRLADRLLDEIQREVAYCLMRAARPSGRDPRQEVRDIVHDVLVMLFDNDARELRRWDPDRGRTLDNFVRLLARRRAVRILGRRRTDPWKEPPLGPEVVDAEADDVLVERLEDRAQLGEVLHALHDKMSERDHELFEMLFVEEREPDEVAEAMDMTRGAVNAWVYRMRKHARAAAKRIETKASLAASRGTRGKTGHGG